MKCPNCGNKVVQKKGKKVLLRVKGKIEFEGGKCVSNCFWCGEPVRFNFPLGDISIERDRKLRYIVSR